MAARIHRPTSTIDSTVSRPADNNRIVLMTLLFAFAVFVLSTRAFADSQLVAETPTVSEDTPAQVDQSFLSMALHTSTGESQTVSDHMQPGRWTLVMIWSVNCHVCKHETPTMSDFHETHRDSLATVVGIALDGEGSGEQVAAFGRDYDMRFPTLIGDLVSLASAYQGLTEESLRGTPTFMLFNPDGVLQGINPGPLRPKAVLEYIKRKS